MIETYIENIVDAIETDGGGFTFLHSSRDWQNLQADELTSGKYIFLDFPVQGEPVYTNAGALVDNYTLVALFLYKTNLDDTNEQIKTAVNKAHDARKEFILRVKEAEHDSDAFFRNTSFGKWSEIEHLFDTDLSGVIQPFNIQTRPVPANCTVAATPSLCLPVTIKNTLLTLLSSTASGGSYTVTDSNVSNSDDSYSVDVPAETSLELPDVDHTDSNGATVTLPAMTAMTCSPSPVGAKVLKTGQTTSYRTNDDGDLQAGRATDFSTLASNNPFGNTNRFTDELGGQTYANDIVIDWTTYDGAEVLGIKLAQVSGGTWYNYIDLIIPALTTGGYSDWRMINARELNTLMDYSLTQCLNYAPFNQSYIYCLTSTARPDNSAQCIYLANFSLGSVGKSSSVYTRAVRNFTNAELGI